MGKIIYPTPWKPTLVKGVPRDYLLFGIFVSAIFMMLLSSFVALFTCVGLFWVYGALKAKEDPEFFTVYAVRILKLKATKGDYKGREYLP